MEEPCNIAILGSTGSIGVQTLDIVARHPDLFKVRVLVAGSNVQRLSEQAAHFRPDLAVIADESKATALKGALESTGVATAAGSRAIFDAMQLPQVDMVVTSTVGYSGLEPTVKAIEAGKDIALANKETLVVAGEIVTELARKNGVTLYPVDSEHSAICQCLWGERHSAVRRLIITASGGPFRTWSKERLATATVADALNHPNWSMGNKITVDSATMMNKAFEMIEARWLFDIPMEQITAVVHPQSIVHSMVEFVDGSIKAQLGVPDMRLPIKLALTRYRRLPAEEISQFLTLDRMKTLTFEEPDTGKFPCLLFAQLAAQRGGNTACVVNAANEVAVGEFLKGHLRFTDIPIIIEKTLEKAPFIARPSLQDYISSNAEARAIASELTNRI